MTIESKLNELIDQTFRHEALNYKFKSWKKNNDKYVLITDRRTFVLFPKELGELLDNIEIIETPKDFTPTIPTAPPPLNPNQEAKLKVNLQIYEPTETQKTIQTALLDALKKVSTDDKYIPQAKSICDIANTVVNMEKNQIALMNAVKRR